MIANRSQTSSNQDSSGFVMAAAAFVVAVVIGLSSKPTIQPEKPLPHSYVASFKPSVPRKIDPFSFDNGSGKTVLLIPNKPAPEDPSWLIKKYSGSKMTPEEVDKYYEWKFDRDLKTLT